METNRRSFLHICAAMALAGNIQAESSGECIWNDVEAWGVEGQGWPREELTSIYDRLPSKAEGVVRKPVWNLSRHSAGLLTRFATSSSEIRVRYQLTDSSLAMPHMPATGASGVDLYGKSAEGDWRWIAVTKPTAPIVESVLTSGLDGGNREYTLYFPLWNQVEKIEIGVEKGASFTSIKPRVEKPIVFYGTSITHGACASRPGMTHVSILGRRLNKPVINLGFSGNGKMESEVGALLAELDPAVFVIDCLPNMTFDSVAERSAPLVRQIRESRPDTPILLIEDRTYGWAWVRNDARERHQKSRAELIRAYDQLVSEGVTGLHYLEGGDLLGQDGDGTTDGSHPNDLGFFRQANALEPVLRKLIGN